MPPNKSGESGSFARKRGREHNFGPFPPSRRVPTEDSSGASASAMLRGTAAASASSPTLMPSDARHNPQEGGGGAAFGYPPESSMYEMIPGMDNGDDGLPGSGGAQASLHKGYNKVADDFKDDVPKPSQLRQ